MTTSQQGESRRARLVVFDVNETLSDMAPMARRFEDVGAPGHLAATWFAGVLRDGFALTAAGAGERFATIATAVLRQVLQGHPLTRAVDEAVTHVMEGFAALQVHEDVPEGVRLLDEGGLRLVTLSNGAATVAERLLREARLLDRFERLLSVEQAGVWKPAMGAYHWALDQLGVEPADAVLVAVHPWDVDGARRAGLAGAWLNRSQAPYPDHFLPPDLEVATLPELARRLATG